MKRALIVVDCQMDFCEGGPLAVEGGREVARKAALYLQQPYDHYVATRDWHISPGLHWSDDPDYQNTWPVHCQAGTPGAMHCPPLSESMFDAVFDKGMLTAAYSGFEGICKTDSPAKYFCLDFYLRDRDVVAVDVIGIATDYCVRATACEAATLDYETRVLMDAVAHVAPETRDAALAEMENLGVVLVKR